MAYYTTNEIVKALKVCSFNETCTGRDERCPLSREKSCMDKLLSVAADALEHEMWNPITMDCLPEIGETVLLREKREDFTVYAVGTLGTVNDVFFWFPTSGSRREVFMEDGRVFTYTDWKYID